MKCILITVKKHGAPDTYFVLRDNMREKVINLFKQIPDIYFHIIDSEGFTEFPPDSTDSKVHRIFSDQNAQHFIDNDLEASLKVFLPYEVFIEVKDPEVFIEVKDLNRKTFKYLGYDFAKNLCIMDSKGKLSLHNISKKDQKLYISQSPETKFYNLT